MCRQRGEICVRSAALIEDLGVAQGHALYGAQDVAQGSQGCALHACGRLPLLHHRLRTTWARALNAIAPSIDQLQETRGCLCTALAIHSIHLQPWL